jgi:cobalamin biosynthesis protein CobT
MTAGEYEVTIATGPSFQSEREAANEFVQTMIPNLEQLPLDPMTKLKLMSLMIKTQDIGPIGDEMIKLLNPPDAQAQQQLQQLTTQAQQNQETIGQLNTQLQKLLLEKQGKVIDNEYMLQKAQIDNKLKLDIAEIGAKSQDAQARAQLTQDLFTELQVHAASAAEQAVQHAHEKFQSQQAAQQAQQTQQTGQAHEAGMAAQAQAAQQVPTNGNGATQ